MLDLGRISGSDYSYQEALARLGEILSSGLLPVDWGFTVRYGSGHVFVTGVKRVELGYKLRFAHTMEDIPFRRKQGFSRSQTPKSAEEVVSGHLEFYLSNKGWGKDSWISFGAMGGEVGWKAALREVGY